jgi:hypothetical protein
MQVIRALLSRIRRRASGAGWAAEYGGAYRSADETTRFAINEIRRIGGYIGGLERLRGRSFLEIGPGMDLGVPLLAAGFGAESYAIDRYPCPFDPKVHPEVYRLLIARAKDELPGFDPTPVEECLAAGAHRAQRLHWHDCGLEDLRGVPDAGIHVTYSNATFEHLADARLAIEALYGCTAPGGVGFHQIDFRDHRDFSRPLEYLTLAPEQFDALFRGCSGSCGNAVRGQEFEALARAAGFEAAMIGNMFAPDDYVADIRARAHPRCRDWPKDWFATISGRLVVRRPGPRLFELSVDGGGDPLSRG